MQPQKSQFQLKRIQPTSFVFSKQKKLGQGSYGEVYLGFDQKSYTPVAIKTISYSKLSQSGNPVSIDRAKLLAQKLASQLGNMHLARNQRLVGLISPHQSTNNLYVVCEYCNGGSLKEYIDKKGILSEREAMGFFKDIIQGFWCLYGKKIVHRDMKPANLLLHNHRIKIGDLGFSKCLQEHQQMLTSIVGTPLYMSPQILNNSTYSQKTDIWSLGIILYQMLVGEAPWKVNSIQEIKEKVRYKPEFPKGCVISQEAKELIYSMLQYQQKDRACWEDLFKQYLGVTAGNGMQEEGMAMLGSSISSNSTNSLQPAICHFLSSLAIQSLPHIFSILISHSRPYYPFYMVPGNSNSSSPSQSQIPHTAREFFQRYKQHLKQQAIIEPFVNMYIQKRNQIAFLIRLYAQCEALIQGYEAGDMEERKKDTGDVALLGTMLMSVKYAIVSLQALAVGNIQNKDVIKKNIAKNTIKVPQPQQIFLSSTFYKNFLQLLSLDLQLLNNLFNNFLNQSFIPKIKALSSYFLQYSSEGAEQISQLQRNLKPFYTQKSLSQKFTWFWLDNMLKGLFNWVKKRVQNSYDLHKRYMIISRMIYQYQKAIRVIRSNKQPQSIPTSVSNIFQNMQQKSNIDKKIEIWCSNHECQKFLTKIKQLKYFQIQPVNKFLGREMNSMGMGLSLNMGMGMDIGEMGVNFGGLSMGFGIGGINMNMGMEDENQ